MHLLQEDVPHRDVILIEGARQVGKTTLAEHVLHKSGLSVVSLNLEKHTLLRSRIDETHEFSEFEELLRDERKDIRYPVGRVKRLVLRPFSFTEFLVAIGMERMAREIREDPQSISAGRHKRLLELLDDYLAVGGLPNVVLAYASHEDFEHRRREIIADYEQDFLRLFGEETIAIVKGCLRSVANFVGAPSKNSSVIPSPTSRINDEIRRVFSRLEDWRLLLHSQQRGPSPEASHRYLPKRYLFDTGVLRSLREGALPSMRLLTTLDPAERRVLGGIVENQLAIELMDQTGELAGWKRTPSGLEIDFVAKSGTLSYPIECKAALHIKRTHLRGLFGYLKRYRQEVGLVVSFAPYQIIPGPEGTRIANVPLYLAEFIQDMLRRGFR
jgi:predicted AAA+ superfamily ATPase